MKILNNLKEKPTLADFLSNALPVEKLSLGNASQVSGGRDMNFIKVIMLAPHGLLEDYGKTIGGILTADPNHIVIYDTGYLPVIQKIVGEFEQISEGVEVTIELRAHQTKDYSRSY